MTPVPNPFLASTIGAVVHDDPAQTDSTPYAVPQGTCNVNPLALPQLVSGPINIATVSSTSLNYRWAVSSTSVSYVYVANDSFTPVATLLLPNVTSISQTLLLSILNQPFNSIQAIENAVAQLQQAGISLTGGISGAYSFVDNTNTLFVNYGNTVYAIGLNVPGLPLLGISVLRSINVSSFLDAGEHVAGLNCTYDGKVIIIGTYSISVVDRSLSGPVYRTAFGTDETISNSIAVDENNGIYVVSDKYMRKVVWTGSTLSQNTVDGAWQSAYPTGDTFPTVYGSGSGSTPTLMGFGEGADKLVVITDGKKRMGLVAFWRNEIPTGFTDRIAGQIQVTCGLPLSTEFIQTEQSVCVKDYGAFVVNNISASPSTGQAIIDSIAKGPVLASAVGIERFEWDPVSHSWHSVWTRADVSDNSMIPVVSTSSNIVFVNGYYTTTGWEVTGLDWLTGQTVHRTILGPNIVGNGFYAILEFLPDGDLLFNSIIGHMRVQLPGGVVNPF